MWNIVLKYFVIQIFLHTPKHFLLNIKGISPLLLKTIPTIWGNIREIILILMAYFLYTAKIKKALSSLEPGIIIQFQAYF
ncbi:MAG: hypothetical protein BWY74_02303 [Firmicutes bacterium ADurb.Bin419]|nr:MAG: hypothetical protein BWY74_02303 [Firmicutes bacterium ADurb.Bin419]